MPRVCWWLHSAFGGEEVSSFFPLFPLSCGSAALGVLAGGAPPSNCCRGRGSLDFLCTRGYAPPPLAGPHNSVTDPGGWALGLGAKEGPDVIWAACAVKVLPVRPGPTVLCLWVIVTHDRVFVLRAASWHLKNGDQAGPESVEWIEDAAVPLVPRREAGPSAATGGQVLAWHSFFVSLFGVWWVAS